MPRLETAVNTDIEPQDETYVMPCAEAMLAGTLALMTGHAQSTCARQRDVMAKKILSNLLALGHNADLTPHFRCLALRMQQHWNNLLQASEQPAAAVLSRDNPVLPETQLWHATPPQVH